MDKPIFKDVWICCSRPMAKAGFTLSGTHRVQRWKCSQCGQSVVKQNPQEKDLNSQSNNKS